MPNQKIGSPPPQPLAEGLVVGRLGGLKVGHGRLAVAHALRRFLPNRLRGPDAKALRDRGTRLCAVHVRLPFSLMSL